VRAQWIEHVRLQPERLALIGDVSKAGLHLAQPVDQLFPDNRTGVTELPRTSISQLNNNVEQDKAAALSVERKAYQRVPNPG
jgi:hypothetical protein